MEEPRLMNKDSKYHNLFNTNGSIEFQKFTSFFTKIKKFGLIKFDQT